MMRIMSTLLLLVYLNHQSNCQIGLVMAKNMFATITIERTLLLKFIFLIISRISSIDPSSVSNDLS